jgi:2-oxoglutarate ferredoxin oxidoreductase subunit alpha
MVVTAERIIRECRKSMNDISVLVGGKAGDGINNAGAMVAWLLDHLGYRVYLYFDYPSLIRGGHNFAIVRASEKEIGTCHGKVDFVLALTQETVDRHRGEMHAGTAVIFNADLVKTGGQGISIKEILAAEGAPDIMGNSAMIGAFARAAGIDWEVVGAVFRAHMQKGVEQNIGVARRAYGAVATVNRIVPGHNPPLPLLTGNEAIGLGLVIGGLDAYVSYPMTPSSGILHFLAEQKDAFGISVVHPENEIAAILMALGFAYAGKRAAAGTSGGGFCLMTEGVSLAGMAELPVVIIVSQRTGPSTGLPTYTGQSDLRFVLHAGQGEFPRVVIAPGDAQEALVWSAIAMETAWSCQVPVFILPDKTLSECTYAVDPAAIGTGTGRNADAPEGTAPYRRYAVTPSGISPLAFPGRKDAVVKVNSYAHDEDGYTTEDAETVNRMTEKRLRKAESLAADVGRYPVVQVAGSPHAPAALVCWGSTKGVCSEVGQDLGLRVVRPIVLEPFPAVPLKEALAGVTALVCVEENATGQLAGLLMEHGIATDAMILRYDGRPFTFESLREKVRGAIP